jgi:hypothetical protein
MIKTNLNRGMIIPLMVVLGLALLQSCKKDIVEVEKLRIDTLIKHDTITKIDTIGTPYLKAPIRPLTASSNPYITSFFEYMPAPGQFINTGFGTIDEAKLILKNKDNLISLGACGGYVVYGFDHTVLNVANKEDVIVFGNAFNMFAEPGVIWVMADENGNGKPDDTWYELKGSQYGKEGYIRNYSVTYTKPVSDTLDIAWKDNQGNTGFIKRNIYNQQPYWPQWITANEYTLTGTQLPSTNIDDSNPQYITSRAFDFGYADNTLGGDKVDISNAIDKDGKRVRLKGIDFIKVQTGILYDMGWLGEQSTEVFGIADLSIVKLDE